MGAGLKLPYITFSRL